jgi:hypothetical protein
MVPPEPRLPEARRLIERDQYFVVHAPRQTGKTTTLAALAQDLTAEGGQVVLRFSCERAKVAGDDYAAAELQILAAIAEEARRQNLPDEYHPPTPWPGESPGSRIHTGLAAWAYEYTQGQPWLVNALAREIIDEMRVLRTTARRCAGSGGLAGALMCCAWGQRGVRCWHAAADTARTRTWRKADWTSRAR